MRTADEPNRCPARTAVAVRMAAVAVAAPWALAALACGGSAPDPTDPGPGPSTGSLAVATTTTGTEADPDGYTLLVDGDGRAIGVDDSVVVEGLDGGDHAVELTNLADDCLVPEGGNPRTVSVPPGEVASTEFAVSCEGRSAVRVTTTTVAGGLDPDGFRIALDGDAPRTIGPDDAEVFVGLASGEHVLELSGLAANCSVTGENPRSLSVARGDTAALAFEARCGLRDRLLFASDRAGTEEIWVIEVAGGSDAVRLVGSEVLDRQDPAISPDGSQVLVAFDQSSGGPDLYLVEADGTNPTPFVQRVGDDQEAAWSPDGSRVAFASNHVGVDDIWVMDADGTNDEPLTGNGTVDEHPTWSPDGSRIAFASFRDGDFDIWVMDADGSNEEPLTTDDASDVSPTWSPDGSRIAFQSDRDGNDEIYVLCVNGAGAPENLTEDPARDRNPAWSPDGTRIAFESGRAGSSDFETDIFTMDPEGAGLVNHTEHDAVDRLPAWSPQSASGPGPAPGPSTECQVASP